MHGTTLDIRANIFGDDFDLQLKFILNKVSSFDLRFWIQLKYTYIV